MSGPTQRTIKANGISLNVAEQGEGPMVLLCHGFPESWYSWRHQLEALAAAGYQAVAPDMRGYGKSDKPEAIDQYTIFHMIGDLIGVLDAFEAKSAIIVGHDWGAGIAWHAARLRPDRFRAAAILSVPYRPRSEVRPTSVMPRTEEAQFYQLYFQEPGVAEAEFEADPRKTLAAMLFGGSGDGVTAIRAMAAASGQPSRASAWSRARTACCQRCRCRCRHGSAPPTSIITPPNSPAAGFAGRSTTIATSTATGS